ncbi:MAG: class I adenylate-forming enzyme family protein [Smithella sp.]|jgi:long-chain acyl-CoA synthetase
MGNNNKSFKNLMKAIPKIATMEQTQGLLKSIVTQWGAKNALKIISRTTKKMGVIATIKGVLNFRLNKFMPYLLISKWDVLGDREAIISGDKRITFNMFKDRVFRLANGLQSLGLKPKDKFAELLYNGNEFFEAFFAGCFIGCPMPFMNWHMKGEELAEAINRGAPKALIFDEEFVDEVLAMKDKLKTVRHFIVVGKKAPADMILYENLLASSSNHEPDINFIVALNPYTGGTTGTPKNVNFFDSIGYAFSELSEAPEVSLGEYLRYLVLQFSFVYWFGGTTIKDPVSQNMRCLLPGPLYHAGTISGWAPFLLLGGTAIPVRGFDPEEFLQIIEKERINWVFVVPTMLQRILDLPAEVKKKYNLSSMHSLICAAAPATPELKQAVNKFFREQGCTKNVFTEFYGSSETAVTSVLLPGDYEENSKRYASVGKIRCAETKIFDKDNLRWCSPGIEGRIMTRSLTTISLKYAGTPEKLDSVFENIDGQRWFDDGLQGYMDKDGFLYLTGRIKEMIISGGVNIFPLEIESTIIRHPKVLDVGVVRYPNRELGEVPAAVIQLRSGEQATPDEIISFCRENGLAGMKVPKVVEFVSELPRHIDGKMIKRELEDKYWQGIEKRG